MTLEEYRNRLDTAVDSLVSADEAVTEHQDECVDLVVEARGTLAPDSFAEFREHVEQLCPPYLVEWIDDALNAEEDDDDE